MKFNAWLTATVLLLPVEAQAQALDFVGPLLPDAGVSATTDAGVSPASAPESSSYAEVEEKLDETLRRVEELEYLLKQNFSN